MRCTTVGETFCLHESLNEETMLTIVFFNHHLANIWSISRHFDNMEQQPTQIREHQKASWNKFSSGWKKWDDLNMEFLKPVGDEIIRLLHPKDSELVLDVASGTGEPALTIASMLTHGKVTMTDLSAGMLDIARENAGIRGLKNIETQVCDVCELPFADNSFDAISCRMGFMFFPDLLLAAEEMVRVLKPGGRLAVSVWSAPEKNFWITATMGIINSNLDLPQPAPGAAGMFRCAGHGFLTELFSQSGLKNISEKEIVTKLNFQTTDVYWNMMTEVGTPIVAALSNTEEGTRVKIKEEVYQTLNQLYSDGNVIMDSSALVVYGEK